MKCRTIRDIEVCNKRVLMRADFNVPLDDGHIIDDARIRAVVPTVHNLLARSSSVILCSHLGRPGGKRVPKLSLRPVALALEGVLGRKVTFVEDCLGPVAQSAADSMMPDEILLLENTRFYPGEQNNDSQMASGLAELADIFVNDAFGSAHRRHASIVGVAERIPAVAGLLLEQELEYLDGFLRAPMRPFVSILGGSKISDKIGLIESLLQRSDRVLIGGGMANTFFRAQGIDVGASLVENDVLEEADRLLEISGDKMVLPTEVIIADKLDSGATCRSVNVSEGVANGWRILDIGAATIAEFAICVRDAQMVFWNGPMGVFELTPFATGTNALARLVAESDSISVVGGGDSVAAVRKSGMAKDISHISTGGGASLEFLQGITLPGVEALLKVD